MYVLKFSDLQLDINPSSPSLNRVDDEIQSSYCKIQDKIYLTCKVNMQNVNTVILCVAWVPHSATLSPLQKEDQNSTDLSYMTSEKAYRIVLAGDAAVGKSSFLLRLCKNEFKLNSSATLGRLEKLKPTVCQSYVKITRFSVLFSPPWPDKLRQKTIPQSFSVDWLMIHFCTWWSQSYSKATVNNQLIWSGTVTEQGRDYLEKKFFFLCLPA